MVDGCRARLVRGWMTTLADTEGSAVDMSWLPEWETRPVSTLRGWERRLPCCKVCWRRVWSIWKRKHCFRWKRKADAEQEKEKNTQDMCLGKSKSLRPEAFFLKNVQSVRGVPPTDISDVKYIQLREMKWASNNIDVEQIWTFYESIFYIQCFPSMNVFDLWTATVTLHQSKTFICSELLSVFSLYLCQPVIVSLTARSSGRKPVAVSGQWTVKKSIKFLVSLCMSLCFFTSLCYLSRCTWDWTACTWTGHTITIYNLLDTQAAYIVIWHSSPCHIFRKIYIKI